MAPHNVLLYKFSVCQPLRSTHIEVMLLSQFYPKSIIFPDPNRQPARDL